MLIYLGPIWYHSETSDVPYSPNQFLGWNIFCRFLQQDGFRAGSLLFLCNIVKSGWTAFSQYLLYYIINK